MPTNIPQQPIHPQLQSVFDWIDAHRDEAIADLQTLVRQESVSAQRRGLEECADLVVRLMHADGLPAEAYPTPDGPPCVIGHLPSGQSEKTLLCYAHYDVQPPEPLDKWIDPPYSAAIRDGRMWGRGTTDNKSGVMAFIKAAKAWLQIAGEAPVGLKFITEGEEEIGSIHLGPFIEANPELVRADAMHCLDGGVHPSAMVPDIDLGLKSVMFVELIARGANDDIHSLNAPLLPQPAWDLVRALNTLVDENRHPVPTAGTKDCGSWAKKKSPSSKRTPVASTWTSSKEEWGIEQFALEREGVEALQGHALRTHRQHRRSHRRLPRTSKTIVPNEAARMDFTSA
ncbi:MAG: M20/M25/M40 family metallo-hydrolase [Caldilineaceae bacterium]